MNSEHKLSHKARKRIKEVKRKARPGKFLLSLCFYEQDLIIFSEIMFHTCCRGIFCTLSPNLYH